MADDLPSEFDVVVLGTGMPESILAAAFSRIGQSVLHLDRNDCYSGDWASFNLQGIEKWAEQHQVGGTGPRLGVLQRPTVDEASVLEDGERLLDLPLYNSNFSCAHVEYHISDEEVELQNEDGSKDSEGTVDTTENNLQETTEEQEAADKQGDAMKSSDHHAAQCGQGDNGNQKENVLQNDIQSAGEQPVSDNQSEVGGKSSDNLSEKQTGIVKQTVELPTDTDNQSVKCAIDKTVDCDSNDNSEMKDASDKAESAIGTEEASGKTEDGILPQEVADGEAEKKDGDVDKVVPMMDAPNPAEKEKKWTITRLKSEWRKFNLDLSPKVLYSCGDMVNLLISSDIAKYCEFKTITQILTILNGQLEKVPCSRADVFSSKKVNVLEKRMLMKLLQFCMDYENKQEELKDYMDKPFVEFLISRKLTPNIRHYVQHSIAMATDSMTTEQGLYQMKKFLTSLGRYGNTAFLWSLYGSGELPQSFCRLCAVFGGLYCLRMSASAIILDAENKCTGIVTTEGQKIKCKWLVMESSYAPAEYISQRDARSISRAIILTDKPLLQADGEQVSLMCLPCPDDGDRPVFVLELPPSTLAAPSGVYVYHLTRQGSDDVDPTEDLAFAVRSLFQSGDESDRSMLWSVYFRQRDMSRVQPSDQCPANMFLMSGPGIHIDIDQPVQEAKDIFKTVLPDEEFLPKAPSPDDIIYVDDTEAQVADKADQSEFKETETDQSESTESNNPEAANQSENTAAETTEVSDQSNSEEVQPDQSDTTISNDGNTLNQSENTQYPVNQSDKLNDSAIEKDKI